MRAHKRKMLRSVLIVEDTIKKAKHIAHKATHIQKRILDCIQVVRRLLQDVNVVSVIVPARELNTLWIN
jgi:hypothetical protein